LKRLVPREALHDAIGAAMLNASLREAKALRQAQMRLAKHLALFVRKYRQKYRRLRSRLYRQMRLSFHLDLNLFLNLNLNLPLYRELLAKSYQSLLQQMFATLFGSMFDLKNLQLQASSRLETRKQRLGGRRPVGRGVGGRIVVRVMPDYHIWCMCCWIYARRIARCELLVEEKARFRIVALRWSLVLVLRWSLSRFLPDTSAILTTDI
jgi:hypothetical protein